MKLVILFREEPTGKLQVKRVIDVTDFVSMTNGKIRICSGKDTVEDYFWDEIRIENE